ncbi:AAA domain-containing protein [Candidatus Falkowbacteria bacterium]|jgi:ATP-dependent Clp protease ATP-binding subunit ClpC|nr:AAA domain-containing protein [Candidatus Falkowbacteria bacterium]MBT7007174.1 AAA domain-containing protein [Candidatus Falkowbacteria bacterium]
MNKDNKKNNFIICPECNGTGINAGKKCLKCKGVGVALYLQDKVIYYGASFNSAHILFDKIVRRIEIAFNVVLGLIGLAGILSLIYYGYQYGALYFLSLEYWLTPSPLKLFFWFSLLVDLYLYYRLDQESSQKNKVLPKQYKSSLSSNEILDFDTIWQLKKSKLVDVSKSYTEESKKAIQAAFELTKHFGHDRALRVHLFAILTQFDASAIILARLGVNFEEFKKKVSKYITKNIINRGGDPVLSLNIHKILLIAYLEAHENNDKKVDLMDIILALADPEQMDLRSETDDVEELLIEFDLTYQKLKNVVQWLRIQKRLKENMTQFKAKARYKPKSGLDRAMTAIATPILDQFSEDLTLQAKYGHLFPCIGRETEIETIFRIFEGSRDGGLLIGSQGVGRTAILHGVAQRMVEEDVPESLQDKRLVVLDIAKLLAGVDASGAEQRLLMLASEIIRSGNIVLAVENLHNLSGITAGNQSSLDLSEVFAQILGRHQFYCLATTTPPEYSKAVEGRNLGSVFQRVDVKELEVNDAILVLEAKSGPIEYQNQVYFSYNAIEKAVTLSSQYIHDRMLPEKGLAIIEQAAIMVKKEKGENKVVTGEDVATIVSNISNVPVNKLSEKESEKLLHLEDKIHERMVDQEEAVNIVAASLRRARANLREGKRPIASLLFLGPTGVGKTELAKTVADIYFGNEKAMIRIDMSEYQEKNSISRLIGQGETPGQLTETVRKNPFSLVLFDEVEKAHPDVLNLFLQMMDDGRLTDSLGRTIDFTNTIIIMTSNAGAQFIQDEIKKGSTIQTIKESLIDNELKETYRPEFINRLDGVVVFKPLSMTDVIKIARILIDKVIKNLEEKGITFEVTDSAVSELAELGFDPKYGARPLRRVIQNKIDDELAKLLLENKIKRRDKVVLDTGGEIKIVKADEL